MLLKDKIELLQSANDFKIQDFGKGEYHITGDGVMAEVYEESQGKFSIDYYVTGCYNSGSDEVYLDIKKLDELQQFIKFLLR